MSNFRPINRDTGFLLPPSVDEWLPQRHLARFVVEVIDGLDLSELVKAYRGSGSASLSPGDAAGAAGVRLCDEGVFQPGASSGRRTTRWRFASSPATSIPITTRLPRFASAFSGRLSRCSSRC